MITINYEAWVQGPTAAQHCVYITATGTTPQEVQADALRQQTAIGAVSMFAVGIHNREADWISAFGNNYDTTCRFADSMPSHYELKPKPTEKGWRFLRKIQDFISILRR